LFNVKTITFSRARGDGRGRTSAQLGQLAQSEFGWKLLFNALDGYISFRCILWLMLLSQDINKETYCSNAVQMNDVHFVIDNGI